MDPESFSTHSLLTQPQGASIKRVMAAAIDAVDPYLAVLNHLRLDGEMLLVGEQKYDLSVVRRILVVGAGKAGYSMAKAVAEVIGERISAGLVITKEGHVPNHAILPNVELCQASHPVPDQRGADATTRIANLLAGLSDDDLVLCLISGGGSALLISPAKGITLPDIQVLTSKLLACGANINEINVLRKHIDLVKGGGLVGWASPARVAALILSDVIGDPLEVIASGPCVPDPSTFKDALAILEKYAILDDIPAVIRKHIEAGIDGKIQDTIKETDPICKSVQNLVIANNYKAAQAGLAQAELEGWRPLLLTTYLQGEARQAGRMLAAIARQVISTGHPLAQPVCLVAGGETTVTLQGNGAGGRNQELALGAVLDISGLPNTILISLATDGGDGPTNTAGAVVTGETYSRARSIGLSVNDFLANNDSYHFFHPLDDLLLPGPTFTNVNDLIFLFIGSPTSV